MYERIFTWDWIKDVDCSVTHSRECQLASEQHWPSFSQVDWKCYFWVCNRLDKEGVDRESGSGTDVVVECRCRAEDLATACADTRLMICLFVRDRRRRQMPMPSRKPSYCSWQHSAQDLFLYPRQTSPPNADAEQRTLLLFVATLGSGFVSSPETDVFAKCRCRAEDLGTARGNTRLRICFLIRDRRRRQMPMPNRGPCYQCHFDENAHVNQTL